MKSVVIMAYSVDAYRAIKLRYEVYIFGKTVFSQGQKRYSDIEVKKYIEQRWIR